MQPNTAITFSSPKQVKHDYLDNLRRSMALHVNATRNTVDYPDRRYDVAIMFARTINAEYRRLFIADQTRLRIDTEFTHLGVR